MTLSADPASFIVNLCALPAPLDIPQPRSPELQAFRFFVSHRLSEHERFFLSMGFFSTFNEAEEWSRVLSKTYPNAYVSTLDETPPVSNSDVQVLTEAQTLRVLEVRPRSSCSDLDEARSASSPPPPAKPAAPVAIVTPPKKSVPSGVDDALVALAASEFEMDSTDSLSTTGVRHLRVEVERKPRRLSRKKS